MEPSGSALRNAGLPVQPTWLFSFFHVKLVFFSLKSSTFIEINPFFLQSNPCDHYIYGCVLAWRLIWSMSQLFSLLVALAIHFIVVGYPVGALLNRRSRIDYRVETRWPIYVWMRVSETFHLKYESPWSVARSSSNIFFKGLQWHSWQGTYIKPLFYMFS